MKQKDIAVIIVIAFVSAIVSFLVSNKLFVTPQNRQQQVEVVDRLDANNPPFQNPDKHYFNNDSIDPTQQSQIGNDNNQNPFNGGSQ